MCDWTEEACAPPNKKWKLVAEEASCQISKRVQKVVDHWESSNKILKKIDEEIIDVFVKEFGLMEHQVNELEGKVMLTFPTYLCTLKPHLYAKAYSINVLAKQ